MPSYRTSSSTETRALGERVGRAIIKHGLAPRAVTVLLAGALGAGKTTFVKGVYRGLGSRAAVTSPTFIIMRRNRLIGAPFHNIFHVDAYRLSGAHALRELGFKAVLEDAHNVVLLEWSERVKAILPRTGVVRVSFKHGRAAHLRRITISGLKLR